MNSGKQFLEPELWTQRGINDARARKMQYRKNSSNTWIFQENRQAYKKGYEEESMRMLITGEISNE